MQAPDSASRCSALRTPALTDDAAVMQSSFAPSHGYVQASAGAESQKMHLCVPPQGDAEHGSFRGRSAPQMAARTGSVWLITQQIRGSTSAPLSSHVAAMQLVYVDNRSHSMHTPAHAWFSATRGLPNCHYRLTAHAEHNALERYALLFLCSVVGLYVALPALMTLQCTCIWMAYEALLTSGSSPGSGMVTEP